jgi:DNA-binding LacI/PurR family transcriptional regulator
LIESGVDGLLFAPNLGAPKAAETMAWLATTGIPVVLVERTATVAPHHEVMESVVTDHALGAAMAVRHLASLGHRKIGLVAAERSPTSPHVRRGWVEAITELGLEPSDTVDARVPSPQAPTGDDAFDAALRRCIDTGTTSLLIHADAEAMALVQRCEDRGISVPRDLSIVAYDDEVASLFSPSLSAVRPPRRSIGRSAIELLAARLADPGRPSHRVIINPTLHVRQSSSAPPSSP